MMDFEKARIDALKELSLTNQVNVLNSSEIAELTFNGYNDVWQVSTEVFLDDDSVKSITIFIALPEDFPLILPKLYLSKKDYDWIRYIPHVNTDMNICLYDDEYITVDPDRPGWILIESIRKARKIIEAGIKREDVSDFLDEFVAYWRDKYHAHDSIILGLSLLSPDAEIAGENMQICLLRNPFQGYSYILLSSDDIQALTFIRALEDRGIKGDILRPFYLGVIEDLKPPFFYTNISLYDLIRNLFPGLVKPYQSYLDTAPSLKVVVFGMRIKRKIVYFGWNIGTLNTVRSGFRTKSLSQFQVYQTFSRHAPVKRFQFDSIARQRLLERTNGRFEVERHLKLVFAGLGSIGSNLLQYLYSPQINTLTFVDPDVLKLENVNRHLLGMSFVNYSKVSGLKSYFNDKNPYLEINAIQRSIVSIVKSQPTILNESDYIFIVIGKNNIERYIIGALASGQIRKPVFVLWVEPFLCGGHCLHLNPGHTYKFDDDYEEGLYKYNIIDSSEYKNADNRLLFREAGCQSSYVPYGQHNITLFISSILPHITKCLEQEEKSNFRLTWKGNEDASRKLQLKLSDVGRSLDFGSLKYTIL